MLYIDQNTLLVILVIIFIILIIAIMIFISFMYYTKCKFDSIKEYNKLANKNSTRYKDNINQYNKNLYKSGIKTKKENKMILKIIKIVIEMIWRL